jgi:hypothetical protein
VYEPLDPSLHLSDGFSLLSNNRGAELKLYSEVIIE